MQHNSEPTAPWSLTRKIFFRYCTTYFLLYLSSNLGFFNFIWTPPATWAGKWLIAPDFEITVWTNGSGDTTYNYLVIFCILLLSVVSAIIWSVVDRKRKSYNRLFYWVMVVLRYSLAITMLTYGMAKITQLQFRFPSLSKLEDPFGNTSPMGLAWNYMGYSRGYNLFTGLAEFIGGFFLFFRRTSLFAALWCMTVMLNVVAMNIFYDIPVKLFSMHLFLFSVFVALPDRQRLINFFFLQKPVAPTTHWYPVFQTKWKRITLVSLKYLVISTFISLIVYTGVYNARRFNTNINQAPLYGIYEVSNVNTNSTGLLNDRIRNLQLSQKIYIEKDNTLSIRNRDMELSYYSSKTDTVKQLLSYWTNATDSVQLHYQHVGKDSMSLHGIIGKDSIDLQLKRKDPNDYLLVNRGFHWINEHSMNR